MILFLEQSLNGLQFGLMLFLLAAGLTLVSASWTRSTSRTARSTWSAPTSPRQRPRRRLVHRRLGAGIVGTTVIGVLLEFRCCAGSTIATTCRRCWHLRDPADEQRGRAHDLGLAAILLNRRRAGRAVELLPGSPTRVSAADHRVGLAVAPALRARHAHPRRHAGARRCVQREMALAMAPTCGACSRWSSAGRSAVRGRRRPARAAAGGASRHGREHLILAFVVIVIGGIVRSAAH